MQTGRIAERYQPEIKVHGVMHNFPQTLAVRSDAAKVNTVVVQRPLKPHSRHAVSAIDSAFQPSDDDLARLQHDAFVHALEDNGIQVIHFDAILAEVLKYADGRDWILERRMQRADDPSPCIAKMMPLLEEMEPECLAQSLLSGLDPGACRQTRPEKRTIAATVEACCLQPLPELTYPRRSLRWVGSGAVIGQGLGVASRAMSINIAAVLHFAPFFDDTNFDFLMASDGAEPDWPIIDGRDIAVMSDTIVMGAATANTSVAALHLLASALFRRNRVAELLCVDLQRTGITHLDDCLSILDRDCILADRRRIDSAPAFVIRDARHGGMNTVEAIREPFIAHLASLMAPVELRIIDASDVEDSDGRTSLTRCCPLVLMPGKVLVFEEDQAAVPILEQHGIKVIAMLPGSAFMGVGRGPRSLAAVISASPSE